VLGQRIQFTPACAAILADKNACLIHARIERIGLCLVTGLKLPDAIELETCLLRIARPILNLLPTLAKIIAHAQRRAIGRVRSARKNAMPMTAVAQHAVDLPAAEQGAAFLPVLALSVGFKDKKTLDCSHQ
jgi:hypothetical protein